MSRGRRALPRFQWLLDWVKRVPLWIWIPLGVLAAVAVAVLIIFKSYVQLPPSYPLPDASVFFPPEYTLSPDTSPLPGDGVASMTPVPENKDLVYRILLAVMDQDNYNTDALMVAKVNCTRNTVDIISIPRDTYVDSATRTVKKVNGAYAGKDAERLVENISSIMGFTPDYYIIGSLQGVREMVDLIGGITFNVPRNMNYDDPAQKLHIHFRKGEQKLGGQDAVNMLRYRVDNGSKAGYNDYGRMQTAQDFMKAYVKQALTMKNFLKLPDLPGIVEDNMASNLSWGQMLAIALELEGMDGESGITAQTLPTEAGAKDGVEYVFIQEEEAREMIRAVFSG